jgi:hypothetical protein
MGELSFSAKNRMVRTYGVNFIRIIMSTQLIERIQKLRHRPLSSYISLSRLLENVAHVNVKGFRAAAG